jgi:hypothetical protein
MSSHEQRLVLEYDLEAAIKRIAELAAELAELRANPPKPIAIVMGDENVPIHAFEDHDEAVTFCNNEGLWLYDCESWTWHPRTETKE